MSFNPQYSTQNGIMHATDYGSIAMLQVRVYTKALTYDDVQGICGAATPAT